MILVKLVKTIIVAILTIQALFTLLAVGLFVGSDKEMSAAEQDLVQYFL